MFLFYTFLPETTIKVFNREERSSASMNIRKLVVLYVGKHLIITFEMAFNTPEEGHQTFKTLEINN